MGSRAKEVIQKMRTASSQILNLSLWAMTAMYAFGGIHIDGKLRGTYMADIWMGCAILYAVLRVFLGVRFRETHYGRSWIQMVEGTLEGLRTRSKKPWSNFRAGSWILFVFAVYLLFLFLFIPLLSHWAYGTNVWDLAIIDNAVFNGSREGRFITWFLPVDDQPTAYVPNNHLNLGLIFFAAIYKFWARPEILLISQSVALVSALIPIYLLADRILPREIPRWVPLMLYFFWDPIHRMNTWDVHEAPFVIPFCLWGFYFIETGRLSKAFLMMGLMAIWREDAWWTFAGMSFYAGMKTKRWGWCLPMAVLGFLAFPLHVAFFNTVNTVGSRYGYLGPDMKSAVMVLLTQPWVLAIAGWNNIDFFIRLLLNSGGGIYLLAGWALVPMLPTLMECWLATNAMTDWRNHYVGNFAGPLFFATIVAWGKWYPRLARVKPAWAELAVSLSVALSWSQLSFNEPGAFAMARERYGVNKCLDTVVAAIPPEIPAVVQSPVAAHVGNRRWLSMPYSNRDQTAAQMLVTPDPKDLTTIGLVGKNKVAPWKVIDRRCDWYIAVRADSAAAQGK